PNWRQLYPYIRDAATFTPPPTSTFAASSAPSAPSPTFDYIVVGGGAVGCPLAATLSKGFSVLLLERGGVPYDQPSVYRREAFPYVLSTRASVPFRSEDGVWNRRGIVLGGGSSVNAGFYSRASADFVQAAGWDPVRVRQSFEWVEERIAFVPQQAPGGWQQAFRDGMLEAGLGPWRGQTPEHMIGTKLANSIFDSNGTRRTAADLLKAGDPARLKVLIYATVQRILLDVTSGTPRAAGVVFTDSTNRRHIARLNPGGEQPPSAQRAVQALMLMRTQRMNPLLLLPHPPPTLPSLSSPLTGHRHGYLAFPRRLRQACVGIAATIEVYFEAPQNPRGVRQGRVCGQQPPETSAGLSHIYSSPPTLSPPPPPQDTVTVIWHFHGGCHRGVCVDSSYRVHGVQALRVVDGSTFLTSPGTNPMATCLMLGR
ncbi:unnamed protein product, partial [Closterium sp. NIES-54]